MLEAIEITKTFGEVTAVDRLSLKVSPGETICLLGANGAGKTTTVNLLLGFLRPDSGKISICGVCPTDSARQARSHIAYLPENVALYPVLSGLENIRLFDRMARGRNDVDYAKVLCDHGLQASQLKRPVGTYSKGMRQKVGLAIASIRDAKVLLLDEPMSGLDPKAASEFTKTLQEQRESGRTILITTHDIFRAKEVATRIGIMKAGKLVEIIDAATVDAHEIERIYLRHMHTSIGDAPAQAHSERAS